MMEPLRRPEQVPLLLLLPLAGLLLFSGCRTAQDGASREPPPSFRPTWWNFYQRGCDRLKASNVQGAREDFERCLDLRSGAIFGYPKELWRVRTYGLHFLDDYFPHRELGVCLHLQGESEKAGTFLENSLKQEPSGRAKFYLNKVRAQLLAAQAPTAPEILVDPASSSLWTRERRRVLSGNARSTGYIREIVAAGRKQFIELAEQDKPFSTEVALLPGVNRVSVSATDLQGNKATRELLWHADWLPPQLSVREMNRQGDEWVISGTCRDDAALLAVSVNAVPVFRAAAGQDQATVPLEFRMPANGHARIEASDRAGNVLDTLLSADALIADLDSGEPLYYLAAATTPAATAPPAAPPPPAVRKDNTPPRVMELKGITGRGDRKITVVFGEECFFDGRAYDQGGLASITAGGDTILEGAAGEKLCTFSFRLPLEPGTNFIPLVLRDFAGNASTQNLTVVRKEPAHYDAEYRLTGAVTPMVGDDTGGRRDMTRMLAETAIARDPPRFHLVARGEELDGVLLELDISSSKLANPRVALEIGKLVPAEMLFMGTLLPKAGGYTVLMKTVDTTTGAIRFSEDVYIDEQTADPFLQIEGLAMKMRQRFPLASGAITAVSGSVVEMNVGFDHGIRAGTKFVVIERIDDSSEIEEGEVVTFQERFVQLTVSRSKDKMCTAKLSPKEARDAIKVGDYVYAR